MFNVSDTIYIPDYIHQEKTYICTDCGGTLTMKVTLFDGTEYTIACDGCSSGWNGPQGCIIVFEKVSTVVHGSIKSVIISDDGISYKITKYDGYSFVDCYKNYQEEELYRTIEEAQSKSDEITQKHNEEQELKYTKKQWPDKCKTWKWHVSYHRKEIREAEQRLKFSKKALNFAKKKVKEENPGIKL